MSATPVLSQLPSFEVVNQKALALKNCSVAELLQQDQNRAADFTTFELKPSFDHQPYYVSDFYVGFSILSMHLQLCFNYCHSFKF